MNGQFEVALPPPSRVPPRACRTYGVRAPTDAVCTVQYSYMGFFDFDTLLVESQALLWSVELSARTFCAPSSPPLAFALCLGMLVFLLLETLGYTDRHAHPGCTIFLSFMYGTTIQQEEQCILF